MIYDLIIYLYLLGVAVYSRFNEKVRKMWRGERAAFSVLKEKVDPEAKYVWFHAASLGVAAEEGKGGAEKGGNLEFCDNMEQERTETRHKQRCRNVKSRDDRY